MVRRVQPEFARERNVVRRLGALGRETPRGRRKGRRNIEDHCSASTETNHTQGVKYGQRMDPLLRANRYSIYLPK